MNFPLAGNSKIRLTIENALKEHRLPHAVLIDGDIGTGRHTLAHFLSVSAVCESQAVPCGNCKNCRLAESGNHPDITTVSLQDGKKNIAVSQIRELKTDAYIKPHMAHTKVFIIDCADTLNEQSQNALLKVLEEPPGSTLFILIAESKAALLETIISRCVVLTLNAPSESDGFEYISNSTDYESDEISEALKNSQNNIGKALMLLKGNSDTKTATAAKKFLNNMLDGNEWGMLDVLSEFEKNRIEADRFLKDLKLCLATEIKQNPKSIKSASLSGFYNMIEKLQQQLITNVNLSLLFSSLTAKAKECIIKQHH